MIFYLLKLPVRSLASLGTCLLFFGATVIGPRYWMIRLSKALAEMNTDIRNVEPTIRRSANPLTSETRVMKSYTERARIVCFSERSSLMFAKVPESTSSFT